MSNKDRKKSNGPGRPKDPQKNAAILEAAKHLFLLLGYEGCSMDAVATEAGVSKLTVYSHFHDKENLFAAAITSKCQESLPDGLFERAPDASLEQQLRDVGQRFITLTHSKEALDMYRLIIAQGAQTPELSRFFFEAGPERVLVAITQLLSKAHSQGELYVDYPRWSAEQFISMLHSLYHLRLLIGFNDLPDLETQNRHIERVVQQFLQLHRADKPTAL